LREKSRESSEGRNEAREEKKTICLQRSATVWLAPADTNKTRRVVSPPPLLLEAATAASAILSSGMVSESIFFLRYPLTQPSKMGEKTQQKLEAFRVAFLLLSHSLAGDKGKKTFAAASTALSSSVLQKYC
jgi:hypothetical protein